MKYRLILWMFILAGLAACGDDEKAGFDVPVEFRQIAFEPVPGGAMMRYRLPDNLDIFGVRVRYTNAYGKEQVKEGTYLTDTLLLNGFNEAQTDVPVEIFFLDNNLRESEPMEMSFNTRASATVALFDNLSINPFWGGFNVSYASPSKVEGTLHVFYIGTNPRTHEPDSILIGSYPIQEGGDTLNFELKQALDELIVVLRTDDYDGNRVKTNVYPGLDALAMEQLNADQFDFSSTAKVIEDEAHDISVKYLFDGQKKGANYRKHYLKGERCQYGTFLAGPGAFGERFIFDLRTPQVPAMLLGDAFLYHGYDYTYINPSWPDPTADVVDGEYWHGVYMSRLPAKLKLYGTNAADPKTAPLSECTLLYTLDESVSFPDWYSSSWCRFSDYKSGPLQRENAYRNKNDADFESADPISLRMLCSYEEGRAFRYLFFIVEDTPLTNRWSNTYPNGYEDNPSEYITFDEIEVFVKKINE